ncbi:holin [Winogradskya humida]|uniref:Holin n=1 Tax=Winogradskya humida TaxID=113566 RepID=A0ABQ4A773_9ACTN|nr:holin [Actinoplanes humidus]GIE26711.1 hypothetical protein Ahu01nite_098130 [Actinoplanes humidus]
MLTKKFWLQAGERAVKSAAQALIGLIPLDQFNVLHADVPLALGVACGALVLSVLTSIVTAGVGEKDDPSAVTR